MHKQQQLQVNYLIRLRVKANRLQLFVYLKVKKLDKPVAMSVTDDNGKILQKVEGTGNFTLTISSMGRKVIKKKIASQC